MMVRNEDVPLKPLGKWKRKKTNYEAVEKGESSDDEDETLFSSEGYASLDSDEGEDEIKKRQSNYRRARWFVCCAWKWWYQR